jgi:argininosuccinate lyase
MAVLEAIAAALLDLRRLAWDLSLFTTAEFNFVKLPDEYTTGSSIMPNKRNPDVIELLRASYASVAAARTEIEQLLSLPSGYQRDLQSSKGSLFHGVRDAYRAAAATASSAGEGRSPEGSLQARTSPGAGNDLRLDLLKSRLAQLQA